ncbi:uncharacterized protein LOC105692780 isoform X2 [Athalia rosae]|uniref:uncharacterized protein LOC105692780 isoform X2 n=1 Tax=Athalia rosae TaxID=37344 RepID=UPI002033E4F4|nr:uncharacterized protein LOC105692780 isoform X2 [Athalia rosae]
MKWPLLLLWLLLSHSGILGAQQHGCKFPDQWRGEWFQSGVPPLVAVNETTITTKGRCIDSDGDKFLIVDRAYNCERCMVIHKKHSNVLQYKETFCLQSGSSILDACAQLAGDAPLNSLFRSGAAPSKCPFEGPLHFSYNRGQGECSNPPSLAETCTHESRLLLRYQACHDVLATESTVEELECLATWREGSTRYLVARLNGERLTTDEDRYRCFIYAKSGRKSWNLAQSGDATCSGVLSATEGARTLKMTQSDSPVGCDFPHWVVSAGTWVALDLVARLLTSPRNLTILDQDETRLVCHSVVSSDIPSSSIPQTERRITFVAKATRGCKNGYVCLVFHRRDGHVIEMQQSETWSQQSEDACKTSGFNPLSAPYTTFITSEPISQQCPHLGSYKVASWRSYHPLDDAKEMLLGSDGEHSGGGEEGDAVAQEVKITPPSPPSPTPCHQDSVTGLDIGCRSSHRMEFAASCTDEAFSVYWCHGSWEENGTAYVVASTEAARYCLIYSATAASGGSNDLSVTNHFASCPRPTHPHHRQHIWKVNLTAYAQCGKASSSSVSWKMYLWRETLFRIFLSTLYSKYVAR